MLVRSCTHGGSGPCIVYVVCLPPAGQRVVCPVPTDPRLPAVGTRRWGLRPLARARSLPRTHTRTPTHPSTHTRRWGLRLSRPVSWRWGLRPLASVLIARRARVCAISTRSQPSRCSGGRITARMVAPLLRWLHRCMVSNDCVDFGGCVVPWALGQCIDRRRAAHSLDAPSARARACARPSVDADRRSPRARDAHARWGGRRTLPTTRSAPRDRHVHTR